MIRNPPLTPVTYVVIWVALLILTAITTGVAFLDLGSFNVAVAILISCIKAALVALFFMHLIRPYGLVRVIAGSAVVFFLILIFLTFGDYVTRDWLAK